MGDICQIYFAMTYAKFILHMPKIPTYASTNKNSVPQARIVPQRK